MQNNKADPPPLSLHTVLLRHECGERSHFDWMFEDPTAPPGTGKLVTFRLAAPTAHWARLAPFALERIDDHRRDYLTYEGPLTGDRGAVRRVDEGVVYIHSWGKGLCLLDVRMGDFAGALRLQREEGSMWRMSRCETHGSGRD